MLYYEDRRYTIIEKSNGLYDIYDGKFGGKLSHENKSKKWADQLITKRKEFLNKTSRRKSPSVRMQQLSIPKDNSVQKKLPQITERKHLDTVKTENLAAKLLETEDFSNYKYPWLAKVIQLCLEYLTLEGLQDAYRSSQIPDEILNICETECRRME